MNGVMFFVEHKSTGSSSRGILSGGVILSKEDLLDETYFKEVTDGHGSRWSVMYQEGRSALCDSKSMSLKDFERIFNREDIDHMFHLFNIGKGKVSIFRKEIVDKYFPKELPDTTSVYVAGDLITGIDNVSYIYMGAFSSFIIGGKEYAGHMYIPCNMYAGKPTSSEDTLLNELRGKIAYFFENNIGLKRCFLKSKRKALVEESRIHYNLDVLFQEKEGTFDVVAPPNFIRRNPKVYTVSYTK